MMHYFVFGFWFLLGVSACNPGNADKDGGVVNEDPQAYYVETKGNIGTETMDSLFIKKFLSRYPEYEAYQKQLYKFYSARNYRLAWTDQGDPIPHASLLINLIENVRQYGIPVDSTRDYHLRDSLAVIDESTGEDAARQSQLRKSFDLALTSSYFRYTPKLWEGVIDPHDDERIDWYVERKSFSYGALLDSILNDTVNTNPFVHNRGFHSQYLKLRDVLKRYSRLQKDHPWRTIELEKPVLSRGDSGNAVISVTERLSVLGDLSGNSSHDRFNDEVYQAVVAFQTRHGLQADGVVGPKTLSTLNTSLESRLKQILLNMERWRWVPVEMTGDYVFVNIPEFRLYVVEDDKAIQKMKVVVGKRGANTVVFNDMIKYVVVNPYWNIPRSIATEEILPLIKDNPRYLQEAEIEVGMNWNFDTVDADTIAWENVTAENFKYTLRKKPGPENPLGRIKFIFPNDFAIYLHDTPAKQLFGERRRGFSHGCIRVEKPYMLSRHLIERNDDYSFEDIQTLLRERENKWIQLNEPLPVYILYFTVWVDETNTVQFRDDIYGHDAHLAGKLFREE